MGKIVASTSQADRLVKDRDQAEADLNKANAEIDRLAADANMGILTETSARLIRRAVSAVPGLGVSYNPNSIKAVADVVDVVEGMSAIMQRLFDENASLRAQAKHHDNMLASAGDLFTAMMAASTARTERIQNAGDQL